MNEEHIISGDEHDLTNIENSYTEIIFKRILRAGDKIALIDSHTNFSLSYRQVAIKSLQLAAKLKKHGFGKGDTASICMENRLEFPLTILACLYSGITIAPLNYGYTKRELEHCVNISRPRLIFCSEDTQSNIVNLQTTCPFIEHIFAFESRIRHPQVTPIHLLYTNLKENVDLNNLKFIDVDIENDIACIFSSSGTTGLPKGVMISHMNLIVCHHVLFDTHVGFVTEDDVIVTFLPMYHAYGFMNSLNSLGNNITVIVMKKFEFETYLQHVERYRATVAAMVPPICVLLAKSKIVDKYDISSIRIIICGAAPLSRELILSIIKRLNITDIRQGFGMSETTLALCIQGEGEKKYGSVGRIIPSLKGKVVDLNTGEALGPYKSGELCFKGKMIMKGYCRNPEETAIAIDKDGWLHTGDIGYYDKDYDFFIVDRLKELIKYKGFQVPPAELEALLLEHKAVKDVGVVGIPDENVGERAVAFVVKEPNTNVTARELQQFIADRVSSEKRLYGGVQFVDEIPKNPSGKILRRELKLLYKPQSRL